MPGVVFEIESKGLEEQIQKLARVDEFANRHLVSAMGAAVAIGKDKWIKNLTSAAGKNLSSMVSGIGSGIEPLAPANPSTPRKIIRNKVLNQGAFDVIGVVEPSSKRYVRMGEVGRGPGKHPPIRAMQNWAENVMGVAAGKESKKIARELSHAIAQRGVKPTPILEETSAEIMGRVNAEFLKAADKITKELEVKK